MPPQRRKPPGKPRHGSSQAGRGAKGGSSRSSSGRGRTDEPGRGRTGRDDGRRSRSRHEADQRQPPEGRKPWAADGGQLPRWVAEELARVTSKASLLEASERLTAAAEAFAAGKYGKAHQHALAAKELSSRDATIREVLALAAYRLGKWDVALRELRTFRRFTGTTTHLPVEMDVLRALDRPDDVAEVWNLVHRLGADRSTKEEARVVYGSFLLDGDNAAKAWEISKPDRLHDRPSEGEVRQWYVAAKAAARLGDLKTARRLYEAVQVADPALPGLDDLDRATRA